MTSPLALEYMAFGNSEDTGTYNFLDFSSQTFPVSDDSLKQTATNNLTKCSLYIDGCRVPLVSMAQSANAMYG